MRIRIRGKTAFGWLDRSVFVAIFAFAIAVALLTPSPADASGVCTWFIACYNQGNCFIESYQCSASQGDCESICDWEEQMCITECVLDEGGSQSECQQTCQTIWFACNRNCIPSI